MSKNILDNLFSSRPRVKILRFLFRNYPAEISVGELSRRIQEPYGVAKKEVEFLAELGLLKKHRLS